MSCPSDENNRYLGLTGVIINESYARTRLAHDINDLKCTYFDSANVIFHRKEIMNKVGPFEILKEDYLEYHFITSANK